MGCNKKYYGVEPDMLTYEFIGTCNYWKVFMERKKTKYPTKIKIISMVSRKKANYHITYSWNLMRIGDVFRILILWQQKGWRIY